MARKFFVCCNWTGSESTYKVKKTVAALNESRVPPTDVVEVVICPSSIVKDLVQGFLRDDFQIAAEIDAHPFGAWSGFREVLTWQFLAKELRQSARWVILGTHETRVNDMVSRVLGHGMQAIAERVTNWTHERGVHLNESNKLVGDMVACVLGHGMKVIVCVGETLQQRVAGETMDLIIAQTEAIAERVTNWENVVLAYEPEKVATPSWHVEEVHAGIRKWLQVNVNHQVAATTRIIYGGQVNGDNCNGLAAMPDVDGFFLHGAPKTDFVDIVISSEVSKSRCRL